MKIEKKGYKNVEEEKGRKEMVRKKRKRQRV